MQRHRIRAPLGLGFPSICSFTCGGAQLLTYVDDYPLALVGVREGPRKSRARDILGPGMEFMQFSS